MAIHQTYAEAESTLFMTGKCSDVIVSGKAINTCVDMLGSSTFKSGEVLFGFIIKSGGEAKMLKFFGDGTQEISKGENSRILSIHSVEYNSPNKRNNYNAVGQCFYENPYRGIPAKIICTAETDAGPMKAKFITDGKEPMDSSAH